jgi:hypothetical protein
MTDQEFETVAVELLQCSWAVWHFMAVFRHMHWINYRIHIFYFVECHIVHYI